MNAMTKVIDEQAFILGEPVERLEREVALLSHTTHAIGCANGTDAILLALRALDIGRGTAHLLDAKHRVTVMSTEMSCPGCGRAFEELDPRLFSFNSPHGACKECGGFGEIWNRAKQTGSEDTGDSVLENELAADREFEWVDEDEAATCPQCSSRITEVLGRMGLRLVFRCDRCRVQFFRQRAATSVSFV